MTTKIICDWCGKEIEDGSEDHVKLSSPPKESEAPELKPEFRKDFHRECMKKLETTHAYAFYLAYTKKNVEKEKRQPYIFLGDKMYAWQFKYGENIQHQIHNCAGSIYRFDCLKNILAQLTCETMDEFKALWHNKSIDLCNVGLFYKHSKICSLKG